MNQKLLNDIKVAMGKMKEAEKIEASIVNDVKQRRDEIYELQKKCEAIKLGRARKLVYKTIAFFLIVLISLYIIFLVAKMNENMIYLNIGTALCFIGPIVAVAVINAVINRIYKNGTKRSIARADKWWKKHAEANVAKLEAIIADNKKAAEDVIKDDYIISAIPKYNRCSEVLISLYHIVAKGYANNIKDAYAICESEIIRENRRREYREYLREEREEREHELETLDNINSKLDSLNKNMAQREFYEDLILMDLASRE